MIYLHLYLYADITIYKWFIFIEGRNVEFVGCLFSTYEIIMYKMFIMPSL